MLLFYCIMSREVRRRWKQLLPALPGSKGSYTPHDDAGSAEPTYITDSHKAMPLEPVFKVIDLNEEEAITESEVANIVDESRDVVISFNPPIEAETKLDDGPEDDDEIKCNLAAMDDDEDDLDVKGTTHF